MNNNSNPTIEEKDTHKSSSHFEELQGDVKLLFEQLGIRTGNVQFKDSAATLCLAVKPP